MGNRIAEALEKSIARADGLRALDLSDNQLDSATGRRLAAALERSTYLVEFNAAGNPLDAEAAGAIQHARQLVRAAWAKTPEGKADAKARGGGNTAATLLSALSGFTG